VKVIVAVPFVDVLSVVTVEPDVFNVTPVPETAEK
jgi:hypothetical protein